MDTQLIRLIASDLDGTLFHGGKNHNDISRENQEAIRRWQQAGNHFLIATGRPSGIRDEIKSMTQIDCDIIACNGAKVIMDDQLLWSWEIQPELLKELCQLCSPYRDELDFALDMDLDMRIAYKQNGIIRQKFSQHAVLMTAEEYLSQPREVYPNKLFMVLDHPERREFFTSLLNRHFPDQLSVTSSGLAYIEIGCPGVSKGNALKEILQRLKLNPIQAAAIGDELNDLDMLESIPHGFAMSSARQEIKDRIPRTMDSVVSLIDWCLKHNEEIINNRK